MTRRLPALAFLAVFAAITFAAGAAWSVTSPRVSYAHYEGTFQRGRVPFALDLCIEGSRIEGSWYRKDRGAWQIVQGMTRRDGGLTLIERNGEGQEIGRFTLRHRAPGEFTGTWRGTPDGEGHPRTLDVTLREQMSGVAALTGHALLDKRFAYRNRRGADDPAGEFVHVGPELRALSYGTSGEAVAGTRRALRDFLAGGPMRESGLPAWQRTARARFLVEYDSAVAEVLAAGEDQPDYVLQWTEITRAFVRLNECYLLVVENTTSAYQGGAHGVYGSTYGIFDIMAGRRLGNADLFLPGAEARLRPILERKAREVMRERVGAPEDTDASGGNSYFLHEGNFPITENIYLRRDGIGFHYNVYEIAAYAAGDFDLVLTWNELRGILRPGTPADRLLPGAAPALRL